MDKLETFFTPSEQFMQFLSCLLIGALLGILYDIIRTVRSLLPHKNFFVALEDFLFIFIWAIQLMVFAMEQGRGVLRFYFFLGNIIGFAVYHFTIGNLIISVVRKTAEAIKKFLKILFSPFVRFFAFLRQILLKLFVKIKPKLKITNKNTKIHLKAPLRMLYNKNTAKKVIRLEKDVEESGKNKKTKQK